MDTETRLKFMKVREWILLASAQFNVSAELITAICWQETSFDMFAFRFEPMFKGKYVDKLTVKKLKAYNPFIKLCGVPSIETERIALATSWGAMQLMGLTAREGGFKEQYLSELCSPLGLLQGSKYLKTQLDRYNDDVEQAISAYNAGTATTYNRKNYVEPVLKRMQRLLEDKLLVKEVIL